MDRKKFIKTSGVGLGLALLPGLIQGQNSTTKNIGPEPAQPKIMKGSDGVVLNVLGDIQTHKFSGADNDNQIAEWVSHVDPGVGIPPHIHTKEDEIFRVIEGEVEIMVGDKTTVLKAGDIAFAPRDVPHAWKVVGTEKAKMIATAFPAGIEHMFVELAALPKVHPTLPRWPKFVPNKGFRLFKM